MKEVQVRAWCDACAEETETEDGPREPAPLSEVIAIGARSTGKVLDLCERHDKALLEPLRRLLADVGQDPDPTPQTPAKRSGPWSSSSAQAKSYPCLWCASEYATGYALTTHVRNVHGKTGRLWGTACPSCGTAFGSPASLGVHAVKHDARSVAQLFRVARDEGDVHGIVAAVRDGSPPRKRATARRKR